MHNVFMASTDLQPGLEIAAPAGPVAATRTHRWIDLGLVLVIAFGSHVLGSIYLLFHPVNPEYTNPRLLVALCTEITALVLFLVLFKRQGRTLKDIGLNSHWTDALKSFGLALAALLTMRLVGTVLNNAWFLAGLRSHQVETRGMFTSTSIWALLPFLLLNPFFEEILVRGYLTTELIDLRKSVVLATLVSLGLQTSYHLYYGLIGALTVGSGLAVFAIYYAKSRRLMPVILAHMLWDLTALLGSWHR